MITIDVICAVAFGDALAAPPVAIKKQKKNRNEIRFKAKFLDYAEIFIQIGLDNYRLELAAATNNVAESAVQSRCIAIYRR